MSTQGFTTSGMDDASLRGTVEAAFRHTANKEKLFPKCGFSEMETKRPFEEFTSYTGLGVAKEKHAFMPSHTDTPRQNYTKRLTLVQYSIATGIDAATLRFIKAGHKSVREAVSGAALAGDSMAVTNELMATDVYGNAFSTTLGLHPDGQPLCSATHKLGGGGTYSNTLGAVSMSQTSFENAIINSNKVADDRGVPMGVGDKRIVVCPSELEFTARRILESTEQSDTANRAINVLHGRYDKVQPNRFLPSSSNWFVVNTDVKHGLIAMFETKPEIKSFGDDKVDAMWFRCYQMCTFDYFEPRAVFGSSV